MFSGDDGSSEQRLASGLPPMSEMSRVIGQIRMEAGPGRS